MEKHWYLEAVGVEWSAKEHVQEEQLTDDVGEIEQLDKYVYDDQVVTATAQTQAKRAPLPPPSPRLVSCTDTPQISTIITRQHP